MSLEKTLRDLARDAYAAYRQKSTAARKQAAEVILNQDEAPATALLIAVRHVLGPGALAWEPESLWLELGDISYSNRDEISAAIALTMTPSFYWDYRVFGATVQALNHMPVVADQIPHFDAYTTPWAVYEAELIFALGDDGDTTPHFDDEPAAYVATLLHDAGFVHCPPLLSFASDLLTKQLTAEGKELATKVKQAWAELPKEGLEDHVFEDTSLGAQLQNLASSHVYLVNRAAALRTALDTLK